MLGMSRDCFGVHFLIHEDHGGKGTEILKVLLDKHAGDDLLVT